MTNTKGWRKIRCFTAFCLSMVICFSGAFTGIVAEAEGSGMGDSSSDTQTEDLVLNVPVIELDETVGYAKQKVTYDCIYFGSYPQAEVVTKQLSRSFPGYTWNHWRSYLHDDDLIEDDALYNKLENAVNWKNDKVVIDGETYCRVRSTDADFIYSNEDNWSWTPESCFYNWGRDEEGNWDTETYHYFKYEPIKWRILDLFEVEDEDGKKHRAATLSADRILDTKKFNETKEAVTWENSTLRAWLNDASDNGFMGRAFTEDEIENSLLVMETPNSNPFEHNDLEGNDTEDAIYLLSEAEAYGNELASIYGFVPAEYKETYYSISDDEARQRRVSLYASAMGAKINQALYWGTVRCGYWWLRSTGAYAEAATYLTSSGGSDYTAVNGRARGVCPALTINLDETGYWEYAGKVSTDNPYPEKVNTYTPAENTSDYHNPVIGTDESRPSGHKVTYDTIYFGTYPQAEVLTQEMYADEDLCPITTSSLVDGDVIVDDSLYAGLNGAAWNNNETTIGGEKYRRIRSTDAVFARPDHYYRRAYAWGYAEGSEEAIDTTTYHYFKYEPIRWRILSIEGEKALLMADKVLDAQLYNINAGEDLTEEVTINGDDTRQALLENSLNWKTSTVRSWLNSYDGTENRENADYENAGFLNKAFSKTEQAAIVPENLEYIDCVWFSGSVWDGSRNWMMDRNYTNPVSDSVFLLSQADVWKPINLTYLHKVSYSQISRAQEYGFVTEDQKSGTDAMISTSSSYAKAMGNLYVDQASPWYLRDASSRQYVYGVTQSGSVYDSISCIGTDGNGGEYYGIRPALYLDLSKTDVYSDAGIYCTNAPVKNAFDQIEAEVFDAKGGYPGRSSDKVDTIRNEYYTVYKNVLFDGTAKSFSANAATNNNGGSIDIHLDSVDGTKVGSCLVTNTGSWDTWKDFSCNITDINSGLHDIYLVYSGEDGLLFDFNHFTFGRETLAGGGTSGGSTGGTTETGGGTSTGGTTESGGSTSTGGTTESGGSTSTEGTTESGGSTSTGGTTESGGSTSTGGTTEAGGGTSSGTGQVGETVESADQEYTVTETASNGKSGKVKWTKSTKTGHLETVTIPKTVVVAGKTYEVTEVGENALSGDTTVKQVNIPDTVTKITKNAFKKCTSLTSVTIPKSVKIVESGAFSDCKSITKVTFAGDEVTTIADDTFSGCTSLTTVTLPKKVTKIGKNAFKKCTKLKSVTIPKTVTSVGSSAYAGCTNLKKVSYQGDKVTTIADNTFSGCSKLETVNVPKKVKKIGKNAFLNCKKLKKVTVKSTSIKTVGKNAFKGTSNKAKITVPSKKKSDYKKKFTKAGFKGTVK